MTLSAKTQLESMGPTVRIPGKFKESDTYYKGAMLVLDANGLLAVPGDNAADMPAGVYTGFGTDPGEDGLVVGAGSNPDGEFERGLFWVPYASAAQARVGELFYLADDGAITQTAGSKIWGVLAVAYKSGYMLLDFANPTRVVDAIA